MSAKWVSQFLFQSVISNPTADCTNALSVAIWMTVASNFNPILQLTNLDTGVPVWIWFQNQDSAQHTFKVQAKDLSGISYNVSAVQGLGTPTLLSLNGIVVPSTNALVLAGNSVLGPSISGLLTFSI
jgi:hypothetical protein